MATGPYLTLSNLPSFCRTRSEPCGRTHSFPPASVSSCNMGTFEAVAMEVNETGLKLKPSKRIRPLSVAIQRYPSAVCTMPLTAPPGNLVSVVHCSRTYCEGRRLGSRARASVRRPAKLAGLLTDARALDPNRLPSQYVREQWTTETRFPGGAVNGIVQTADGYLWIATDRGLIRFDGFNFRPVSFTSIATSSNIP